MINDVIRPIIGISGSLTIEQEGIFSGYKRCYVSNDYISAVVRAGAIPYVLPIIEDEEILKAQIDNIDGLILTGGHDVSPLVWGEEPLKNIGNLLPERDDFDIKLARFAVEKDKPLLGICRGHHILNVAFGGSLYQDIDYAEESFIKHNQNAYYDVPTHSIEIYDKSKLYSILGCKSMVNSFHHLAIKDIAKGFKVSAVSKDGIIEAIEKTGKEFVIGVQWHPEMMSFKCKQMQKIFDALVEEAIKRI